MINPEMFLITPSLLNAWGYIFNCVENVKESESDLICLEDKQSLAIEQAKQDFITALKRIKTPPNQYMLDGIKFEDDCYKGLTEISPIIQNGAFQIVGKKIVEVDGLKFLMYGRLDVLKAGVIYDIKRVVKYNRQKYLHSYQHRFYLDLFTNAKYFEYLIYNGSNVFTERYYRDETIPTETAISQFIAYLKANNLLELYKEKWRTN